MKIYTQGLLVILGLALSACGRSPDSQFYTLSPIPQQHKPLKLCKRLSLGINEIQAPGYMSKPEIVILHSAQEAKLEEYHRWIENLKNNSKSVIEANLTTLLPGAAIVSGPWDPKFRPKYQLQIDILEFTVNSQGGSLLRVDYLIHSDGKRVRNGTLAYHQKVPQAKVVNLVASMNVNLNRFTKDLAKVISSLC